MSEILYLARIKRLGLISFANIERDKSKAMTRPESFLKTGTGKRSQAGPAKAKITNTAAIAVLIRTPFF